MAALWRSDWLSDVRLQLRTVQEQTTDPDQPPDDPSITSPADAGCTDSGDRRRLTTSPTCSSLAKVARTAARGASSPEAASVAATAQPSPGHTLHLHANILSGSSPYFKARLTSPANGLGYVGGSGGSGSDDDPDRLPAGQPPLGRFTLVEHVEEGELDAMEAVLRHCYTNTLSPSDDDDGVGGGRPDVTMLLQMLVLADRFDVPRCVAHCCRALGQCAAADFDVPAVNSLLGDSPAGWRQSLPLPALLPVLTQRLLQLLGDAEALSSAWHDNSGLVETLQKLSLPALLILLSSDSLRSCSENCVLLMADAWVRCPGRHCSAAELRQVASALRLCCLTHTYLHSVLPHLTWLTTCAEERLSLAHYVAAGNGTGTGTAATSRQVHLVSSGVLLGPAAWYNASPRTAPAATWPLAFDWGMPRAVLDTLLGAAVLDPVGAYMCSAWHHRDGFRIRGTLRVQRAGNGQGAWVGLQVAVDVAEGLVDRYARRPLAFSLAPTVKSTILIHNRRWQDSGNGAAAPVVCCGAREVVDVLDLSQTYCGGFLSSAQVLDADAWEAAFGPVRLSCVVELCT